MILYYKEDVLDDQVWHQYDVHRRYMCTLSRDDLSEFCEWVIGMSLPSIQHDNDTVDIFGINLSNKTYMHV